MKLRFWIMLAVAACGVRAQVTAPTSFAFPGVPTGSCAPNWTATNTTNGDYYNCFNRAWNKLASGGGGLSGSGTAGQAAGFTAPTTIGSTGPFTTPNPASASNSQQLATTHFVHAALAALNPATAVAAATVTVLPNTPTYANGSSGVGATLTAASNGALVIDGYTVLLNDRLLINNQAASLQNGVYTQTRLGTGSVTYQLTRATDFNTVSAINNAGVIPVTNGTVNSNTTWALDAAISAIGTSSILYDQTNAAAPLAFIPTACIQPTNICPALPLSPTGNPTYLVTDAQSGYDCTLGGNSNQGSFSLCSWSGSGWIPSTYGNQTGNPVQEVFGVDSDGQLTLNNIQAYSIIQNNGGSVTQRSTINFTQGGCLDYNVGPTQRTNCALMPVQSGSADNLTATANSGPNTIDQLNCTANAGPCTAPTASPGDNTTQIATDAFVQNAISTPPHAINFQITPTATGDQKIYPSVNFACTITGWNISSNASGSISIDIWKANAAIPTSGNKISASAPVALSGAQLAQGGSVSGWTTTVVSGDVFAFNVSSYSTLASVTGVLFCQ